MWFYYKVDICVKVKILCVVMFSIILDVYEFCIDEFKAEFESVRKLKLKCEDDEVLKCVNEKKVVLEDVGVIVSGEGDVLMDGVVTAAAASESATTSESASMEVVDFFEGI